MALWRTAREVEAKPLDQLPTEICLIVGGKSDIGCLSGLTFPEGDPVSRGTLRRQCRVSCIVCHPLYR